MNMFRLTFCILILLGVSSCSTMSKSECQVADWQAIGLEDGVNGRSSSYIGYRRKDCAKHGVMFNLEQYNIGREAGLKQYCTYQSGYRHGSYGYSYFTVCQGEQHGLYQEGYNRGHELYDLKKEIDHLLKDLHVKEVHLTEVKKKIQRIESKLITSAGSMTARKNQLEKYNRLKYELEALEFDLHDFELFIARRQDDLRALKSRQSY